jgi:similar to spore coat protein
MSRYALHELLELHEMAAFKTVCMTKNKTMKALVSDDVLKQIMEQDVETSTRQLKELGGLMSSALSPEVNA